MNNYKDELKRIQAQVEVHEKNRRKFANVADLMEEGSQYSDSMTEIVRDHESKLRQLEMKSKELKILTEVSNQHDDEIQNLKNSIEVMKHQKAEVNQIVRSDSAVSISRDNSDFQQKVNNHFQLSNITPKRSNSLKPTKSSSFTISTKLDVEKELDHSRDNLNIEEKEEIRQLKDEIALLKQKLSAKEKNAMEHLTSYRRNRFNEPHVPTTLNLKSLPTDLSVLETTSVNLNSQGVNTRSDLNNESDRKSEYDWDTGALFGYNLGLGSMMSRQSHQYTRNSDYHSRSTKHETILQQEDHGARRRTESQESNECAEFCKGSFFAQLFRSVFGEQKDPVVRQW
jgi:myosin heavy subunit